MSCHTLADGDWVWTFVLADRDGWTGGSAATVPAAITEGPSAGWSFLHLSESLKLGSTLIEDDG